MRTRVTSGRFTESERTRIELAAALRGETLSELVRAGTLDLARAELKRARDRAEGEADGHD